jgi:hypothetical protein
MRGGLSSFYYSHNSMSLATMIAFVTMTLTLFSLFVLVAVNGALVDAINENSVELHVTTIDNGLLPVENGASQAPPNPVLYHRPNINLRGMQDKTGTITTTTTTTTTTATKGNQNRPPTRPTTSEINRKVIQPMIEPLPTPDFMLYPGCNNRWFERGLGQKPTVRPPDLPLGLAPGECIRSWHCAGTVGLCCTCHIFYCVYLYLNPKHCFESHLFCVLDCWVFFRFPFVKKTTTYMEQA